MANRLTNTNKWQDAWFYNLSPSEKLLWIYLCENCDIAGFYEVCPRRAIIETGLTDRGFEGAFEGLKRGYISSIDGEVIYLRNFLKHQRNLPLNPHNRAHAGILSRFENYKDRFDFNLIEDCTSIELDKYIKGLKRGLQGANKGLTSPNSNCNSNSNNIDYKEKEIYKEKEKEKEKEDYLKNTFAQFWNMYDKKVGRETCEKKWARLTEAERQKIFATLPGYIISQPDKKYRKNPETYLNQKSWNDEIIIPEATLTTTDKIKTNNSYKDSEVWQR